MIRLLATALTCALMACTAADGQEAARQQPAAQQAPKPAAPQATTEAEALGEFNTRLQQYVEMHRRLEETLPRLPKETNPTVIDAHERALEKLIRTERKNARVGDIITTPARRVLRQRLAKIFAGPQGVQFKATILDENPGKIALTVNSRYPDQVPLSTVPPQVLETLPKLPDELEYRFIGERLILLDTHAHTIADYMDNAIPR